MYNVIMNIELLRQISEKYSNFMKIRPVITTLSHVDRRADEQT